VWEPVTWRAGLLNRSGSLLLLFLFEQYIHRFYKQHGVFVKENGITTAGSPAVFVKFFIGKATHGHLQQVFLYAIGAEEMQVLLYYLPGGFGAFIFTEVLIEFVEERGKNAHRDKIYLIVQN